MSQPGNSQASSDKRISQVVFADSMQTGQTMNLTAILSRQRWVILFAVALGLAVATFYWTKATIWYESTAEVLVSQRDQGISATGEANPNGEVTVEDDVLANHMVVLRSRRIIEGALKRCELSELPSILQQLKDPDDDAADYVINHLKLSRGGTGAAKDARSLKISFEHIDPEDTRTILEAIVIEYQMFLSEQMSKSTMDASSLIEESRLKLEKDLEVVQNDYIEARQKAPVLFQGDGSSNVYLEQFRRLHEELLTLDIQESGTKSRYEKALLVLSEKPSENDISIDDLGIIDSDSLKRLGVFAELQANSARSVDFQAAQPERLEEARTNYSHMLQLMSEKRRLESDFGPSHPDVRKLDDEIKLVKSFVEERARDLPSGWNDVALTPAGLLKAYIAFLKSELTSISERRNELAILKQDAETQARMLVEFELKEGVLKSRVDRTQELFDRLVEKLRDLDMATGLKGYVHELLESPRMGIQVWPSLPICGVAGLLLGLVGGLFLAVVNDQLDNRFRSSSEIDESIGVPILGRVGRIKTGDKSPIVLDNSPESESFRVLRTLLLGDVREGRLRIMTATSPLPGDGKTTILCNVAAAFSKMNISVVLIEADMRRPTFHKRFLVPDDIGLSDILKGRATIDQALLPSGQENLTLITAGAGASNPSELLQSEAFDTLITDLASRFQLVILDVGPVLAVSDPVILAQKSDGLLLVVRPANDTKQQVQDAVDTLRSAGAKMLGCVINTFGSGNEFERGGYYGYYYSDRKKPPVE